MTDNAKKRFVEIDDCICTIPLTMNISLVVMERCGDMVHVHVSVMIPFHHIMVIMPDGHISDSINQMTEQHVSFKEMV